MSLFLTSKCQQEEIKTNGEQGKIRRVASCLKHNKATTYQQLYNRQKKIFETTLKNQRPFFHSIYSLEFFKKAYVEAWNLLLLLYSLHFHYGYYINCQPCVPLTIHFGLVLESLCFASVISSFNTILLFLYVMMQFHRVALLLTS